MCRAPPRSISFVPSARTMSSTTPARTTSTVPTATTSSSTSVETTACRRLRRALTPKGTLVIVGGEDGGNLIGGFDRQLRALALSLLVSQRLTMLASKERYTDLEALTPLIESGQVVPVIDRTYPLAEVPAAMTHLESGQARRKDRHHDMTAGPDRNLRSEPWLLHRQPGRTSTVPPRRDVTS